MAWMVYPDGRKVDVPVADIDAAITQGARYMTKEEIEAYRAKKAAGWIVAGDGKVTYISGPEPPMGVTVYDTRGQAEAAARLMNEGNNDPDDSVGRGDIASASVAGIDRSNDPQQQAAQAASTKAKEMQAARPEATGNAIWLEKIRQLNPNWSKAHPEFPGEQFTITSNDGRVWTFRMNKKGSYNYSVPAPVEAPVAPKTPPELDAAALANRRAIEDQENPTAPVYPPAVPPAPEPYNPEYTGQYKKGESPMAQAAAPMIKIKKQNAKRTAAMALGLPYDTITAESTELVTPGGNTFTWTGTSWTPKGRPRKNRRQSKSDAPAEMYTGGYVTKPKKSVVAALKQWKYGL
jgi:hypothetical protein